VGYSQQKLGMDDVGCWVNTVVCNLVLVQNPGSCKPRRKNVLNNKLRELIEASSERG